VKRTDSITAFFSGRNWAPFQFQLDAWSAFRAGKSGIVNAPTGTGKTFSLWGGILDEALSTNRYDGLQGIKLLWVTPLRALATDLANSFRQTLEEVGLEWQVEVRSGDTSSSVKQRQKKQLPDILITTPESLSLLLSYEETQKRFESLSLAVVDEQHDLMSTKRGTQVELALARLRLLAPGLRVWGLSATIGNLSTALDVVVPSGNGVVVTQKVEKKIDVETLIPRSIERFPWAGHIGLKLLPEVIQRIQDGNTSLVFINTRSQAEIWFQKLLDARPSWRDKVRLHHGSLDRDERAEAENGLRDGSLKCVVSTSSLDLGVDFAPVDLVIQVGSPKGVGRCIQRAGRSGHRPGESSRVVCVPTNAFELIEYAALKDALVASKVEPRIPLSKPLDVLAQHLVTIALGGGFVSEEMLGEVRSTYSYSQLSDEEWSWTLDFISRGGSALRAYPQFARARKGEDGVWQVSSPQIAKLHRMAIGTIVSEASIAVILGKSSNLGAIEESFMSRLKPGDRFIFAGRSLELVQLREMKAYVKKSPTSNMLIPKWIGGRLPLSSYLADGVRRLLCEAKEGVFRSEEMESLKPILAIQSDLSTIPGEDEVLLENLEMKDGYFNFLYPFEGRSVHEGLGALLAYRLSKRQELSASVMLNDYGLLILSSHPVSLDEDLWQELLSPSNLLEDILGSLNSTEMAKRHFREIARVAGLIFPGYPGAKKTVKQTQISSGLLFDVFQKYDRENLLLSQAKREVLENQLEYHRLLSALERISKQKLLVRKILQLTPFSFPIWVEQVRATVTSESAMKRVERMLKLLDPTIELRRDED